MRKTVVKGDGGGPLGRQEICPLCERPREKMITSFKSFSAIFALTAFLLMSPKLHAAELPTMRTLSAHVVKVAADGTSIDVDFRHPVTQKIQQLTFYLDARAGRHETQKLQQLRSGQVVNIDYVEGEKHRLLIRRISRVKLSGPPAGLEKFRGL